MTFQLTSQEQFSSEIWLSPGSQPSPAVLLTSRTQLTHGAQFPLSAEPTPTAFKLSADQEPDQSFFRAWGLRSGRKNDSGGSSASTASPLTMPTKRVDLRSDHRHEQSIPPLAHRRLPSSSALSTAVSCFEQGISRKGKGHSETLLSLPLSPPRIPSPSIYTRKSLLSQKRRSSTGAGPENGYSADAADEPRSKLSHLFTIKNGKKALRLGSPRKAFSEPASSHNSTPLSGYIHGHQDSDASNSRASFAAKTTTIAAAKITPALHPPLNRKLPPVNPTTPGRLPNDVVPAEGLYCRIRRQLGLKKGPLSSPSCSSTASRSATGAMLDQTTSLLRALIDEKIQRQKLSFSTSNSNLSIAAAKGRYGGLFRRGTQASASSSLRNIFIGKPHVVTPDSAACYTAADDEQYFHTEITGPGGPNFLPSEARRVGTLPLPDSDSSGNGGRRHRGFFFDYRPPEPGEGNSNDKNRKAIAKPPGWEPFAPRPRMSSSSSSKRLPNPPSSMSRSHSDDNTVTDVWFRVKIEGRDRVGSLASFEFNVPDHLPSSPLCPRHPKHLSGGKGICVYHGRRTTKEKERKGL